MKIFQSVHQDLLSFLIFRRFRSGSPERTCKPPPDHTEENQAILIPGRGRPWKTGNILEKQTGKA
ncbi:hypothetical protein ABH19_04705 [Leptospirillum sp. Group II 'CF-1']|nr:hypothetical protein ABH19_04705 [Leptospirillum sp. Group II 'CF-1']